MLSFFFFNDTATTEISTLSLHDALPICRQGHAGVGQRLGFHRREGLVGREAGVLVRRDPHRAVAVARRAEGDRLRSEEHTSELQSRQYLVCRLLLEKKKRQ